MNDAGREALLAGFIDDPSYQRPGIVVPHDGHAPPPGVTRSRRIV